MAFWNLPGRSDIPQVTAAEAQQKHIEGAVIVDVREPDEWRQGHIAGAVHIPLGALSTRVRELDPSSEIVAVCRSGSRSMTAAKILRSAGFSRVSNLTGGMIAWSRQGLAIRR